MDAPSWLEHEDQAARTSRIARLRWIERNYPAGGVGFLLQGGWLSQRLLEEAKYCFAYGQDVAATVLAVMFIERALAAHFYAGGRDDLERAGLHDLLGEAKKRGWVTRAQVARLEKVRQLRNPLVHFRRPGTRDGIPARSIAQHTDMDTTVKRDALYVLRTAFHVLARQAVGR